MNDAKALEIVDKIIEKVFKRKNTYTLEEVLEKFAFDIKLPKQVNDTITNEVTWADSITSGKFITNENMTKRDKNEGWMLERKEVKTLEDIVNVWNTVNLMTTERVYDSINVLKSDTIYGCENVYRSTSSSKCKNLIYSASCTNSEYLLASSRSDVCNFSIRTDDSYDCSNSYSVICSNKVVNSLFIQDSYDLYECMFCAHIANKRFCIANMQFEEEEYYAIKELVIDWILNS